MLSLCFAQNSYSFTIIASSFQSKSSIRKSASFMSGNEEDNTDEEKPKIVCPDCDKCDGSGR